MTGISLNVINPNKNKQSRNIHDKTTTSYRWQETLFAFLFIMGTLLTLFTSPSPTLAVHWQCFAHGIGNILFCDVNIIFGFFNFKGNKSKYVYIFISSLFVWNKLVYPKKKKFGINYHCKHMCSPTKFWPEVGHELI